nr:PREDICTED: uncharacterized protein LOC107078390 [Lepisosteus oculatus]
MEELIQQLSQATLAQFQALKGQREANEAQLEANQIQKETNERIIEEQKLIRAELCRLREEIRQAPVAGRGTAQEEQITLEKMTELDDVEAYLTTFERTAARNAWPEEQWAGRVAPYLIGEAQKAYYDLKEEDAENYETLKNEILARLGVTMAIRAVWFHNWSYQMNKPTRSQMFDLVHLANKWLQPEELNPGQVVERVVLDHFVRSLPVHLKRKEEGHLASYCPGLPEPMQVDPRDEALCNYLTAGVPTREDPHLMKIEIEGEPIEALLDSGSAIWNTIQSARPRPIPWPEDSGDAPTGDPDETDPQESGTELVVEFGNMELPNWEHPERWGKFGTAQLEDGNLRHAWGHVRKTDGEWCTDPNTVSYPYFMTKNNLLYQVQQKGQEEVEQLLIPRPYQMKLLNLAHSHLMGGHLGVKKTSERLLSRFFWPGIYKAVEKYCRECPECQKSAPQPYRNPLIPLPIIETPFERIGMDLVGPLIRTTKGHQYILVIVDYATRYPEAIPLRAATAKNIARELVQLFALVGIPKEILTDQGTPFMSKVMRDLCKLLGIQQIRTSVYHPQTDGLVERFNKTLKSMLRKTMQKDGKNWDQLLPYLMFAVREVPQASTGFSPFELLYSRKPRGLLDVVKESWEHQPSPLQTIIEHVEQMRERINVIVPLVKENLEKAQAQQQQIYNRGAVAREFQIGDRVLVPTPECKFLASWQGPYEVVEKVGPVNYKVKQHDRRRQHQIYHVNLLKKWHGSEVLLTHFSPDPLEEETGVVAVGDLAPAQKQKLQEFLSQNKDVFSRTPGRTHLVQHKIVTEPGEKVRLPPYRVPEAKRKLIKEEVGKMLEMGIIEESHSEWASPIVLIPRPDGTIRFCNNFKRLNEISRFDAYPMPCIDELIERLGNARYISTLDLTKGYWQVPLAKEDKAKTAFAKPEGLYMYRFVPFGLHGAPTTFQRLMDRILRPYRDFAAAYLDDVVIHSMTWEQHLQHLEAVTGALRAAGLTANPN